MAGQAPCDWQIARKRVAERGEYLLETALWSDCRFIVGTESNQQVLEGHKLFLAMASPVFEAMFYGGMPEKDPIAILDVQPEAFKALLEYIYTDNINLTSFDQACELCYSAKKYMLPHLVEECTKFLWSDLYPKNACRAYEFAKLFEEPILREKCFLIICHQTEEVLAESSFDDVELSTILTIFDQECLNISSELDLFNAISRYAARQTQNSGAKVPRLDGIGSSCEGGSGNSPTIRDVLMKIRFLTLTPQQFAEGPAKSTLLTQSEKYSLLMNISSPSSDVPMPPGFSTSTVCRKVVSNRSSFGVHDRGVFMFYNQPSSSNVPAVNEEVSEPVKKIYCSRQLIQVSECLNTSVLDCVVTFSCDKNICVYGIQVPAQTDDPSFMTTSYTELLYTHLLDSDGSRLTYTHCTSRVNFRSVNDISFNRPVYIQKNKTYKIGVVLNKVGRYPIATYLPTVNCNGVLFVFGTGQSDSRDGLIRSIIFSINSPNQSTVSNSGADRSPLPLQTCYQNFKL